MCVCGSYLYYLLTKRHYELMKSEEIATMANFGDLISEEDIGAYGKKA